MYSSDCARTSPLKTVLNTINHAKRNLYPLEQWLFSTTLGVAAGADTAQPDPGDPVLEYLRKLPLSLLLLFRGGREGESKNDRLGSRLNLEPKWRS